MKFKRKSDPAEVPGFCKVASIEEVKEHGYALTPGRYVGTADGEDEDEPFEERWPKLVEALRREFNEGRRLEKEILKSISEFTNAD